jgi:ATP-dependent phosphoenolpyruvate carboxykinase
MASAGDADQGDARAGDRRAGWKLAQRELPHRSYFGFSVPTSVPGIEPHLLYPMKTWKDKAAFDETARKLVGMFQKNFAKYEAARRRRCARPRPRCGSRRSDCIPG